MYFLRTELNLNTSNYLGTLRPFNISKHIGDIYNVLRTMKYDLYDSKHLLLDIMIKTFLYILLHK